MKRIIALVLSISVAFGVCNAGIAATPTKQSIEQQFYNLSVDIDTEVERARNGISDVVVTPEIADAIGARITDENGCELPVDTYITIRAIPLESTTTVKNALSVECSATAYAATVVANLKTQTDSSSSSAASASVHLTMYWIDNFGLNNELSKLEASYTTYYSTTSVSFNALQYGDGTRSSILYAGKVTNISNNYTWSNIGYKPLLGSIYSQYIVKFLHEGQTYEVTAYIESSILV